MKTTVFRLLLAFALIGSVIITLELRHRAEHTTATIAIAASSTPIATPNTAPPKHTIWQSKIAFQYYETDGIDAAFLAQHIDWLMMRYGAEDLRQQVINAGYLNKVPQYLQLFQIDGPGPYKNKKSRCKNNYTPLQNNVMWTKDFCNTVHEHEDWFLHNGKGERLYTKERNWDGSSIYGYYMNPASEGFRAFWVKQMQQQADAGWQAFFLDNVAFTYTHLQSRPDNSDGKVKEYSSDQDWQQAIVGQLVFIRQSFPDHQVWGNIIEAPTTSDAWDVYRDALDGIQEENFATNWVGQPELSPEAWAAMIERAEQTLDAGKSVVLYGQGEQNDFERMRFSLGSYLLVATSDDRATFRYTYTAHYDTIWWYPEYELDLGLPDGPRRQNGSQWVRDFACGQVVVDPEQRRSTITTHPCREP